VRHNNFMNFDKELDTRGLNCPNREFTFFMRKK
jgi:TusA-related sulfurtransferase